MIKPLICMIAIGAAIGFMLPAGETVAPHSAPAETSGAPISQKKESSARPQETLIERRSNGHFYVTAAVNGYPVDFVVDTGASMVALTVDDARRVGLDVDPGAFILVGRGASGDVRGQLVELDEVDIDGKRVSRVPGAVIEGLDVSLLGQTYLSQISSVQMNGDYMSLR